jgi:hypothetical protein
VSNHPAAGHPANTFLQRGRWTQAQTFHIFGEGEALGCSLVWRTRWLNACSIR